MVFLGVDIFFVISGFLMAHLYNKGSITDFYKRRIDRLLPAYAVTIIATILVGAFILLPVDFLQLFKQSVFSVFFASNAYFWNQNSYFSASEFNPLLNLWSLGVEAQFYLIVPFLYPLLHKRAWLTLLAIILGFVACVVIQSVSPKTSFFLMPFRVWEFLMGAAVAWYFNYVKAKSISIEIGRYALLALMIAFAAFASLHPDSRSIFSGHPALPALFICALTAGILSLGVPSFLTNSMIGRGLAKMGDYSYSIYLVHFPLIVLMNYEGFGGTILSFNHPITLGLTIVLLIGFSCFSYLYVEKKGRAFFNTNIKRGLLILSMAAICAVSYAANLNRYTPQERNIFAAFTDRSPYRCGKVFRILNPRAEICPIGKKGYDRNILLVGDSHADAMKTVFAQSANAQNIGVLFYADNDPLVKDSLSAEKIVADAMRFKVEVIALHFNNKYKKPDFVSKIVQFVDLAQAHGLRVSLISPVPTYDTSVPRAIWEGKDQGEFVLNRR